MTTKENVAVLGLLPMPPMFPLESGVSEVDALDQLPNLPNRAQRSAGTERMATREEVYRIRDQLKRCGHRCFAWGAPESS